MDGGESSAGWRAHLLLTRKGFFDDNWGARSPNARARPSYRVLPDDPCDGIVKRSQPRERFFPAALEGQWCDTAEPLCQ